MLTRWAAEPGLSLERVHVAQTVWSTQGPIIHGLCTALFHSCSKICSTSSKIKTQSSQGPESIISSSCSCCCFTQHNPCTFTNLTCHVQSWFPTLSSGLSKSNTSKTFTHAHWARFNLSVSYMVFAQDWEIAEIKLLLAERDAKHAVHFLLLMTLGEYHH